MILPDLGLGQFEGASIGRDIDVAVDRVETLRGDEEQGQGLLADEAIQHVGDGGRLEAGGIRDQFGVHVLEHGDDRSGPESSHLACEGGVHLLATVSAAWAP